MSDQKSIDSLIEEAARSLLQAAQKEDTPFSDKIKAFSAVTEYYRSRSKGNKGNGSDPESSFTDLRDKIRSVDTDDRAN